MSEKKQPIKSTREDKRGHWPKGKRRNDPSPEWPRVLKRLERLLRSPERHRIDTGGVMRSRRGLAVYLSVSDRQVRRWLALDDMPSSERVQQIAKFCNLLNDTK